MESRTTSLKVQSPTTFLKTWTILDWPIKLRKFARWEKRVNTAPEEGHANLDRKEAS